MLNPLALTVWRLHVWWVSSIADLQLSSGGQNKLLSHSSTMEISSHKDSVLGSQLWTPSKVLPSLDLILLSELQTPRRGSSMLAPSHDGAHTLWSHVAATWTCSNVYTTIMSWGHTCCCFHRHGWSLKQAHLHTQWIFPQKSHQLHHTSQLNKPCCPHRGIHFNPNTQLHSLPQEVCRERIHVLSLKHCVYTGRKVGTGIKQEQ